MPFATNNILVPTDFSEQSLIGLEQSFNLAKLSNGTIYLLYVVKVSNTIWNIFSENEQNNIESKIELKLNELTKKVSKKHNIRVIPLIKQGSLIEIIVKTADEIKAKFIVIGTSTSDNISKKIIGTNAHRIIREANCPVISIKGKHHRIGCDNIILPLDLTLETREKVKLSMYFARLFNAKIHIVSVAFSRDTAISQKLWLQAEQVVRIIKKGGLECSTKIIQSSSTDASAVKKILQYSHEVKGDLIVIMNRQENEIAEYFLGSMAKQMIHQSDIPVLSVAPRLKHTYIPILS